MADHPIVITREAMAKRAAPRAEAKFQVRPDGFYPGAPDEASRLEAEEAVDRMLDRVAAGLPKSATKAFVLSEFQVMFAASDSPESEEREKVCEYCEQVMSVLRVEESESLLNRRMYGVDPDNAT